MKKILLLILAVFFALLLSFAVLAQNDTKKKSKLKLGQIRSSLISNNEFEVHYNVHNIGTDESKNGHFYLWIPEIDYDYRANGYLIDDNKHKPIGARTYHYFNNIKSGTYLTRIVYQDDDDKEVKWVYLDLY